MREGKEGWREIGSQVLAVLQERTRRIRDEDGRLPAGERPVC
jgi:hypothetical protein